MLAALMSVLGAVPAFANERVRDERPAVEMVDRSGVQASDRAIDQVRPIERDAYRCVDLVTDRLRRLGATGVVRETFESSIALARDAMQVLGDGDAAEDVIDGNGDDLGGLIGKEKDAARTLVIQRFPEHRDLFARKKDIGRADATLIGQYCLLPLEAVHHSVEGLGELDQLIAGFQSAGFEYKAKNGFERQ